MTSKAKPPALKGAAHVRSADKTKPFTKDWERLSRSGRYDVNRLKAVMTLLIANDGPLPPEYKDHPLEGKWTEHRECHIGGGFLLIYKVQEVGANEAVIFVRPGTHAAHFDQADKRRSQFVTSLAFVRLAPDDAPLHLKPGVCCKSLI